MATLVIGGLYLYNRQCGTHVYAYSDGGSENTKVVGDIGLSAGEQHCLFTSLQFNVGPQYKQGAAI